MKKLVLSAFLCFSCALSAQEGIVYEIEPVLGYNSFDKSSKMENDFTYGIRATTYMNEFYGYRLGYERADDVKFDVDVSAAKKRTDIQRISGSLLVNGEEEYGVIPYLFAGLGYEILSTETTYDVSQGYVDGGLGFKYMFLDSLNMNIEAKVLKKFDTSDMDVGVNVGIGYALGSSSSDNNDYKSTNYDKNPVSASVLNDVKKKTVIEPVVEIKEKVIEPVVKNSYTLEKDNKSVTENFLKDSTPKESKIKIVEDDLKSTNDEYKTLKNDIEESSSLDKQYYVQMEAWFKGSYESLPNTLRKNGYEFEIRDKTYRNKNIKVVIIGPYDSYNDASIARNTLLNIKEDAFITKL